ncbi:hypothetical protein ACFL3H_07345 [Gemmatimonadota bacterium]
MLLKSATDVETVISDRDITEITHSSVALREFAETAICDIIIAWKISTDENGQIVVESLIFNREEEEQHTGQGVLHVQRDVFSDIADLWSRADMLAHSISRSRNFSLSDTDLLLSIFCPGLGQLHLGEPVHAFVAAGLVTGAALYGYTTPIPDTYEFNYLKYSSTWNISSESVDYFIEQVAVSKTEYFSRMDDEWAHFRRARGERRAAKVRQRRAIGLFCAAYLVNLADAFLLSSRRKATLGNPFSIQPAMILNAIPSNPIIGIRIALRIR